MRIAFLIICCVFSACFSNAQSAEKILTQQDFLSLVKLYHPMVAQANITQEKGLSKLMAARGYFDPVVALKGKQKEYSDKKYYQHLNAGLRIPTWFGIEAKAGFENNSGAFLNPENNTSTDGLYYAGISLPVLQGLVFDKRRAILQEAKILAKASEAEKQMLINDILFSAIQQYWTWSKTYYQLKIYKDVETLAIQRFKNVKRSYLLGDKPAIDTLEAYIQIQNRTLLRQDGELTLQKEQLLLSNFLWAENNIPLELDNLSKPEEPNNFVNKLLTSELKDSLFNTLSTTAPSLLLAEYKLNASAVKLRLAKEGLKPKLNLDYNLLSNQTNTNTLSTDNYTFGVNFSFPLFLRKQRGDLQIAKFNQQAYDLEFKQKLLETKNKLRSYIMEQEILQKQVLTANSNSQNYKRLIEAEMQKFDLGESSLFLVNSRETKFIEVNLKLLEIAAKLHIVNGGILWTAGKLEL